MSFRRLIIPTIVAIIVSIVATVVWSASPPPIITYQGKVLVSGSPASTTLPMQFTIYNALSGGIALYTASGSTSSPTNITITTTQGLFTVYLGDNGTNPIDPSIFKDNDTLYLQVVINGETLNPRKRLAATPYALNSKYLDGNIATSTPTTTNYIPVADSFGNFNFNDVTSTNLYITGNAVINSTTTFPNGIWGSDGKVGIGTTTFSSEFLGGPIGTYIPRFALQQPVAELSGISMYAASGTILSILGGLPDGVGLLTLYNNSQSVGTPSTMLRANETSYMASSSLFIGGNENIGSDKLRVAGDVNITNGGLLKFNGVSGTPGYVLMVSTTTGLQEWAPTSSLGITGGGGSSLPSGTDGQTLYYNGDWQATDVFKISSTLFSVAAGRQNSASGLYSMVGGGSLNYATGMYSSVVGGRWNTSTENYSSIVGGSVNIASGTASFIGGGNNNSVLNSNAVVVGGNNNYNSGQNAFIGAGENNRTYGTVSFIGAGGGTGGPFGGGNTISEARGAFIGAGASNYIGKPPFAIYYPSSIVGGLGNRITEGYSFIGGGQSNMVTQEHAVVVGGLNNTSSGQYSFIGGGRNNIASGTYSSIVGGSYNKATGNYSFTSGYNNTASGTYSVSLGRYLNVNGDNSFGVNVASGVAFVNVDRPNIIVLTGGNVGVGTTTPDYPLTVQGDINFTGDLYKNGTLFSSGGGSLPSGSAGQLLVNNGDANWVTSSILSISTSTGVVSISSGNFNINGVTYSWPSSQGTASTTLVNDGAGNLIWAPASTTAAPGAGGSDMQIQFNSSGVLAGSPRFVWDEANVYLGLGTSTPNNLLHAYRNSNSWSSLALFENSNTGPSSTAVLDVRVGNYGGSFGVLSENYADFGLPNLAGKTGLMSGGVDGVQSNGLVLMGLGTTSTISFYTAGDGPPTADKERMRITTEGLIGIGTTTPLNALSVVGGINLASGTPSNTSSALYNVGGSLYWNGAEVGSGGGGLPTGFAGQTLVNTGGTSWTPTNTLFVNSSGVSIGTSATSTRRTLSVHGDAIINNQLISNQEGGIYFGRTRVSENIWAVNTTSIWATSVQTGIVRMWNSIAMSSDGQYQSAVSDQIYISYDYGRTWTAKESLRNWKSIAISSDGKYQTAVSYESTGLGPSYIGRIYISSNYGQTWTARMTDLSRYWMSVSMSSDGKYQTAVNNNGRIYISSNYGQTWTLRDSNRGWYSVVVSSDGKYQTAVAWNDYIYVSTDYGFSWSVKDSVANRIFVAMSSDGKYQTTIVNAGQIYTSSDFGENWAARDSARSWQSVAVSADGKNQSAVVNGGNIYTSDNFGLNWYLKDTSRNWQSIAMSSDGKYQTAGTNGGYLYYTIASSYSYGNIGINTTTPNKQLVVAGNSLFTDQIQTNLGLIINSNVPAVTSNALYNSGGALYWNGSAVGGGGSGSPGGSDGEIQFNDSGSFGATSSFFWDKVNGRLGVGTSTPSESLTVVGNINNSITDRSGAREISTVAVGDNPYSVYVSGKYVYVANLDSNTVSVVDVNNPFSPVQISTTSVGSSPVSIYVSGKYAYVTHDTTSNNFSIIDISNPSSMVKISTTTVGSFPASIYVSGKYAYITNWGSDNISIVDISNPFSPVKISTLAVGDGPASIYVSGKYAYITNWDSNNISIVDISNPYSPVQVSIVNAGTSEPRSIYVSGKYAYITNLGSDTMSIIDISKPSSPVQISTTSVGSLPASIYVSGKYAYVTNWGSDNISIVDISNPYFPVQVSIVSAGFSAPRSIYVSGKYAYVANQFSNNVSIIDVSGAEVSSLLAHSVEAGSLQIRNDLIVKGNTDLLSLTVGQGGILSQGAAAFSSGVYLASSTPIVTTNTLYNIGGTLYWNGSAVGGSGSPGGSDGEIQFNDSGSFGATSSFFWDKVNGRLGIGTSAPTKALHIQDGGMLVSKVINVTLDPGPPPYIVPMTTTLLWDPDKVAFRVGGIINTGNTDPYPDIIDAWDDGNLGLASVAFGANNLASGQMSFAAGFNNRATGTSSIVFGNYSTSSGEAAFSAGRNNLASGYYATAFGQNNIVSGWNSFVSGYENTVSGANSFAGGYDSIASGISSFAFGTGVPFFSDGVEASGDGAMALGTNVRVTGDRSFALNVDPFSSTPIVSSTGVMVLLGGNVGVGTTTPTSRLTIDNDGGILAVGTFNSGNSTLPSGAGTRMFWYPRKAAFRAGGVSGSNWNESLIGSYSVAFGYDNFAAGVYSAISGGYGNEIHSANYTFVGGGYSQSISGGSHYSVIVGGFDNSVYQAPRSFIGGGTSNTAAGENSFIGGGFMNRAFTTSSVVVGGESNTASGTHASVLGGYNNFVSGMYAAVGGGQSNSSTGNHSFIGGGYNNIATGDSSFIGGRENSALGQYSFVGGGYKNIASGTHSAVFGINNQALGSESFVIGERNTSSAFISFVSGWYNEIEAGGDLSFIAGGRNSKISTQNSAIIGGTVNIITGGSSAFIGGSSTSTISGSQSAIIGGREHTIDANASFIGGGFGNNISSGGNYSFIGGGWNNVVAGTSSFVAGGLLNNISGEYSFIGAGDGSSVTGLNSVAFGRSMTVNGDRSFGVSLSMAGGTIDEDNTMAIMGGRVGIGTTTPSTTLFVQGTAGGSSAWVDYSDERLKTNIVTIENALSKVLSLRGVNFEWKNPENDFPGVKIGLIAQEVKEIVPEVVNEIGGVYGIQYAPLAALLIEAVKDQQNQIDALKNASTTLTVENTEGQIVYTVDMGQDMLGRPLLNVASVVGVDNKWEIDTTGLLKNKISTSEGDKEIYGLTSENIEITLSGNSQLQNGEAIIVFATSTAEIIDDSQPMKVSITLTSDEPIITFVKEKSAKGFIVKQTGNGTSNASFDWIVIAKRKFVDPFVQEIIAENGSEESVTEILDETETNTSTEEVIENVNEEIPFEEEMVEPVVEDIPVEEESQTEDPIVEETPVNESETETESPETPSEIPVE